MFADDAVFAHQACEHPHVPPAAGFVDIAECDRAAVVPELDAAVGLDLESCGDEFIRDSHRTHFYFTPLV